ncbi:MAG: DUF4878 domain-containing protein [Alistipes sp.]|nr:DUF4878 domain-containing protein [Alistipes sp.]
MKQILHTVIIAALAFVVFVGCAVTSSPRKVARHFYKAIAEADYERALSLTTLDSEADPEIYYAIMQKVNTSIAEKGGIEELEVVSEEYAPVVEGEEPTEATVAVEVVYADGTTQDEFCDVVLTDGKWLVDANLDSK